MSLETIIISHTEIEDLCYKEKGVSTFSLGQVIEPLSIFVPFTKQLKTLLAEVHMIVSYIASRASICSFKL